MVHIIPVLTGERRLDTGNVVQYPDSSPVGEAVRQLGDEWQAVAERYQQRMAQQQAFDTEVAARRLNGEIAKAEAEAAANAPADGAGLHDAMYGQVNPRTGQVVKTGLFDTLFGNFLKQAPPELRAGLASRKEALREAGSWRMAAQQLQRRKQYEQDQVSEVHTAELNNIAQGDPNDTAAFDASRQTGLDLLAKMDLDPQIRLQAEADWRASTAKQRMQALIAQDPRRAAEMLSAGPAASDGMGETVRAELGAARQGEPAAAKGDWRRDKTPDEVIAQAFLDDVPKEQRDAIRRQAEAAELALKVKIGAAIGRAEAEAPDEIARTGSYSGGIPGENAYKIVHGPDEGPRRRQILEWQADVGKKIFDMGTMANQAIEAAIANAGAGSNASSADQWRDEATAVAGELVLEKRRVDLGGYVSDTSPEIFAGWKATFGNGPSDPEAYDQDAYDRTMELAVARQKALGVADEKLQPVPFSILLNLAEDRDSGSMYFMDRYAKASVLFSRTKDPVVRAALARELDEAGLGGILPGGKPRLSVGEVLRSDAKAIGKTVANAGIALGNANDWVAYGMSGGTISPPDYKDAYFQPSNGTEKVMMRQAGDALGWAIPGPGVGRAVEGAIPRAIEQVGSGAAGQTERSIAGKSSPSSEVPNSSISQAAPRPIAAEKTGEAPPAAGNAPATASPPKRKPDFFRQPTSSLDDLYAVAPKWQADLEGAGQQIADQVGAKLVTNGAKQRETAYEKIGRNEYKDASKLIDIVRISFVVKTPQQADEIAALLAQRYKVRDGNWHGKMDSAYFDRKMTVRFDDGTLGEVQMLEPNMYKAKTELGGQARYTRRRSLHEENPEYLDLLSQEAALYSDARRNADPIWAEVLANLKGGAASPKSK